MEWPLLADRCGGTELQQALLLLRDRGLVREAPGRGLIVSPLDVDFVRNLYEIRAMLDGLAARLAAERGGHGHPSNALQGSPLSRPKNTIVFAPTSEREGGGGARCAKSPMRRVMRSQKALEYLNRGKKGI
jgi:hypothetical protein